MSLEGAKRRKTENAIEGVDLGENELNTFHVTVGLASGRSESFSIAQSTKVRDLKLLVQKTFNQDLLRLVTADAHVLADSEQSLEAAGVHSRDHLTAIPQIPKHIAATKRAKYARGAFALWCVRGNKVITWGHEGYGGDSSGVQEQLKAVQHILGTARAFAAILEDGSVVTWGHPVSGGDSSAVQDQLRHVQQLQANDDAFAAILEDGSVVTWGDPAYGGDSSAVQDWLVAVQQLQASGVAFAAILKDGSVVTWGHPVSGGDSSAVQDQLRHVQQLQANDGAFAAIMEDGSVVTWGDQEFGGHSFSVQDQLVD